MDLNAFYEAEFDEHKAVLEATRGALAEPLSRLVGLAADAIRADKKLMLFGNGGSAADCQHIATEMTVRYVNDRAPIRAIALTTDTSALTAIANDLSFDDVFARQMEALGSPGDVAIAISTSGESENVIRGLEKAKEMKVTAVGFSGRGGGRMKGLADPLLLVPSDTR